MIEDLLDMLIHAFVDAIQFAQLFRTPLEIGTANVPFDVFGV